MSICGGRSYDRNNICQKCGGKFNPGWDKITNGKCQNDVGPESAFEVFQHRDLITVNIDLEDKRGILINFINEDGKNVDGYAFENAEAFFQSVYEYYDDNNK